jgi:hypothetical protein
MARGWQGAFLRRGRPEADGRASGREATTFEVGTVEALFGPPNGFDVSADGQRFLTMALPEANASALTVVQNWTAGLKK